MFAAQFLVVLLALYVGARYGSLALGSISGIGLAILVFGFGLTPGTPPTDVIYIIVSAVTCAATLQAAGGMDWMLQLAERSLRRHPGRITFYAPLFSFILTVMVGTGHVIYTLMPIIADVSLRNGVRPERPCAVSSVASQIGITASPIAAAVVAFTTISATVGYDFSILQVICLTIPSGLVGLLVASLLSYRRGLDLDKDPEYQARLADPQMKEYMFGESATILDRKIPTKAKASVFIFLTAIVSIVVLAAFQYKAVKMNLVIQIVMLVASGLMILLCDAKPGKAVAGNVFQSGMVAVIAIFGLAWMTDTVVLNHNEELRTALGSVVQTCPWAIAFVFFVMSVLVNSQGAVVVALLPFAYSLGIPGYVLLGVLPSIYGYFFIPNYPSVLATVQFDRSGTTRIGKFMFNHSFMLPGLVSVTVSTIVCLALSTLLYS